MKPMSKPEFIDFMAKDQKLSKAEAERSLNATIDSISKAVAKGNKIQFVGFGSFYTLKNKARTGRNPKTGAPLKIKASTRPAFKAGAKFKALCNK